jgi:hypothetical protein
MLERHNIGVTTHDAQQTKTSTTGAPLGIITHGGHGHPQSRRALGDTGEEFGD